MKFSYITFCCIVLCCLMAAMLIEHGETRGAQLALSARGLLEVEGQNQPVIPYHAGVRFTVAAQPTALTRSISWAILTGSDSSTVNALVSSDVRQGMEMALFQFADLDAKNQAHAFVLIATPVLEVKNQVPFNHIVD